jgi:deazaflavin-dependent oxidoreductase (nitroreductase family)
VKNIPDAPETGLANKINRLGATHTGVWVIKHLISPLQRWVYRVTGGRLFSTIGSSRPVLLLTTKGRRTGKNRTTPVFYLRDGEYIIICNVNPGFERINPWVVNLRANPTAQLQIGGDIGFYQARQATETEVEYYWPKLIMLWPAYQAHFQRGGRRSIFVLKKA